MLEAVLMGYHVGIYYSLGKVRLESIPDKIEPQSYMEIYGYEDLINFLREDRDPIQSNMILITMQRK